MFPSDALDWLVLPTRPFERRIRVPADLASVTTRGSETPPRTVGLAAGTPGRVWARVEALYRTGLYPAIALCVRHRGEIVIDRAIGHAHGNAPGDPPDAPKVLATPDTPFRLYSASKAVTAMVIHKLDELGVLHIDDRVADYLPEFARGDKASITIAHVLAHRAGIPNPPPGGMDLDLVFEPEALIELLAAMPLRTRPGRRLAYHAVTGGFVLGEIVRRTTGNDIRKALHEHVRDPLGLRWLSYCVPPEDAELVASDAITGMPLLPPLAQLFTRALGAPVSRVLELAHDPRFLTGILPAANVVATARDLGAFFECLRAGGALGATRIFDPRTVRRATAEQSFWEIDLTIGLPLRYGLGFMLGGGVVSPFGPDTAHAFGHVGFTNVFAWADPERQLSVALLTSGKPFLNLDLVRLYRVLMALSEGFPKRSPAA